jgi:hypothetical protein
LAVSEQGGPEDFTPRKHLKGQKVAERVGGFGEKTSNSVDTSAVTPYKHTPSTNSAEADKEPTRRKARWEPGRIGL